MQEVNNRGNSVYFSLLFFFNLKLLRKFKSLKIKNLKSSNANKSSES